MGPRVGPQVRPSWTRVGPLTHLANEASLEAASLDGTSLEETLCWCWFKHLGYGQVFNVAFSRQAGQRGL